MLLTFLSFALGPEIRAQTQNPEVLLNTGLKYYQSSQLNEASQVLREAVALDPKNPVLLYNLGLSEFKLGKVGLAMGLWRRALWLSPGILEPSLALQHALKQQPSALNAEHDSIFALLAEESFRKLPFHLMTVVCLVALGGFLFTLFQFLHARQKVLFEGGEKPRPGVSMVISALVLLIGLGFGVLHWRAHLTHRGTVVQKVEAQSAPQQDSARLFELPEGAEVEIRGRESTWMQVRSLTGKSGWVPEAAVLEAQASNLP